MLTERRAAPILAGYLLPVLSIICLASSTAAAFDEPRSNKPNAQASEGAQSGQKGRPFTFGYKLYNDAMTPATDAAWVVGTAGAPTPPSPAPPAVSTAPMTAGEKFKLFAVKSFKPPSPYVLSILGGLIGEATDNDHHRHMTTGDFLADSMTHAARSFTFRATSNFFEKFAFATVFKQDPRYHRSGKKTTGAKIGYAVSRIFITQGDRCGCDQFNISFLGGGLAAAGMSNLWVREDDRTVSRVFGRWGSHIGTRAFLNILSEFLGGQ
ncbi:MAG TPA: hypothetical protein VGL29_20575 [Blastocatellia bacterium]